MQRRLEPPVIDTTGGPIYRIAFCEVHMARWRNLDRSPSVVRRTRWSHKNDNTSAARLCDYENCRLAARHIEIVSKSVKQLAKEADEAGRI